MTYNCSTGVNFEVIPTIHEPARLMRHADAPYAPRKATVHKAEIIEARTQALEDYFDPQNVNEGNIDLEEEEIELECGRAQTTEDMTEEFVTQVEVQAISTKEVKKSTLPVTLVCGQSWCRIR